MKESNFAVFSKLPLSFIGFFTVVILAISIIFCLFDMEDIAQDTTVLIKCSWRFLNITHLYINLTNTLAAVLFLMPPQFGMIYLMMFILPQLLPVSEKRLKP